jgi:hypothetical protein
MNAARRSWVTASASPRPARSRGASAGDCWRCFVKAELPEVAPESIDLALLGEVKEEEPEGETAVSAAPPGRNS